MNSRVQEVIDIIKEYYKKDNRNIPRIVRLERSEDVPTFWGIFIYPDESDIVAKQTESIVMLDDDRCYYYFSTRIGDARRKSNQWASDNGEYKHREMLQKAYEAGALGL
ncbi:MAG: hypothetical protein HOB92_07745 [Candidatus Cloacimonetes bacterium]|jgi:hypothetical protein|nr:hypothetical protein [Candidatus Cloacimonadota bacterium]